MFTSTAYNKQLAIEKTGQSHQVWSHGGSNLKKKAETAKIPALQKLTHMLFQVWADKLAAPLTSEAENGFSWICIL